MPVDTVRRQQWLDSASTLCLNFQADLGVPNAANLHRFQDLREALFNDRHHPPATTRGSVLLPQVQDWMTRVRAGQFDARFQRR